MELNIVSLFSGCGGLDLGFHQAGFNTVWANEYDKTIAYNYSSYFPDVTMDTRSIVNIKNMEIPTNIVGVIGGPPCQSWSEAGARRGLDDHRGKLFYEYLRVIEYIRPLFFVAENVSGITHKNNRNAFDNIVQRFEELGYMINWRLINASDYGVPQDRNRVIIIGYHTDLGKSFVFPEKIAPKKTLKDAIGDLSGEIIGKDSGTPNHELHEAGHSSLFLSRNRVRDWDEQSYTILATDRHVPFHPQAPKMCKIATDKYVLKPGSEGDYRRLTVRECARIQTFPDSYIFTYNHPRVGYTMIGNAVPVTLAYHVARKIKQDIYL